MKKLSQKYQFWWWSDGGYNLEEFDDLNEVIGLIESNPSSQWHITTPI